MSKIKDGRYPVELGGKTYHLLFSLNALDEMQDKFGGYDKLGTVFDQENKDWIKNTKWLLTLLLNEGADESEPQITESQVGRLIHTGNIVEVQEAILAAFGIGTGGDEEDGLEDSGEAEGNEESGQEQ